MAALLDTETPVPSVTSGAIRDDLKTIAVISRVGGGTLTQTEFALTVGWGSGNNGGITMPGKGKTEPVPTLRKNKTTASALRPRWTCT